MPMPAPRVSDENIDVRPADVAQCLTTLESFVERYKTLVARTEQEGHLRTYLRGLVSGLERKSIEPIATAHGQYRRPLQHFVGAGLWEDRLLRDEMVRHVVEEIGDPEGVIVLDTSGFPKKGNDSVGVARQWCGRLGKLDNCQVGVFVGYSTPGGIALLDADLYLTEDWAADRARREKTHVPDDVVFKTRHTITLEQLSRLSPLVPHAWVVGDDEYGRSTEFRDALIDRSARTPERYLLEVPSNTLVRRPPNWPGRKSKWCSVRTRKVRRTPDKWKRIRVRDGERGPIEVFAFSTRVQTKREGAAPRDETLLVMRTISGTQTWYFLAPSDVRLNTAELVRVAAHRHHIEEAFEWAKGEVGLDHYEVRSWVGWHHHMTLSMLALWFLALDRRRLGKKLLQ